jgi:hypothetical protein
MRLMNAGACNRLRRGTIRCSSLIYHVKLEGVPITAQDSLNTR